MNSLLHEAEVVLGLTSGTEPQVKVWTHCYCCGCDQRLVSGPVDLRVHIRPQHTWGPSVWEQPSGHTPSLPSVSGTSCGQAQEPSAVLVLHPAPGPGRLCWASLLLLAHGTPWLVGPTANVSVPISVVSGSLDGVSWAPATCCHSWGCSWD